MGRFLRVPLFDLVSKGAKENHPFSGFPLFETAPHVEFV